GASYPAFATQEVDARFLLGEPTKELCEFIQSGYRASYDKGINQINAFVKDKDVGQKKKESIEQMFNYRWSGNGKRIGENLVDFLQKYNRMSEGLDWKQLKVLQRRLDYGEFLQNLGLITMGASVDNSDGDSPSGYGDSQEAVNKVHEYLKKGKVTWVSNEGISTAVGTAKRVTQLAMQLDPKAGTATVSIEKSDIVLPKQAVFDDYAAERFQQDNLSDCVKILALNPTVDESKRSDAEVKPGTGAPVEQPKRKWWQRNKSKSAH
ncbi:MAG: hypothetical protein HYW49_04760, partial [Deltaproteobacteria bacterium]|nr:hypothetical protein [Deltaproteobacteria bacterium]